MNLLISQKAAIADFLNNGCKIHKTEKDDRGWYLCNMAGHLYLHSNGQIHNGVKDSSAFWETEESASDFYRKWEKKNNKKMQMDTKHCACSEAIQNIEHWNFCPICGGVLSH